MNLDQFHKELRCLDSVQKTITHCRNWHKYHERWKKIELLSVNLYIQRESERQRLGYDIYADVQVWIHIQNLNKIERNRETMSYLRYWILSNPGRTIPNLRQFRIQYTRGVSCKRHENYIHLFCPNALVYTCNNSERTLDF